MTNENVRDQPNGLAAAHADFSIRPPRAGSPGRRAAAAGPGLPHCDPSTMNGAETENIADCNCNPILSRSA
jgi:hypothetical protein